VRSAVSTVPLENRPVTEGSRTMDFGSARYLVIASRTIDATLTCSRWAARLRSLRILASRNRLVRFMAYILLYCMPTGNGALCHRVRQ
jgi:hypothetical protein